ncbi:MAG TPA: methanogenesis marker 6 protein [Candidatus Methanoculleus thermohydrogenotrophicum]|jgi:putative methanogenesis marker protein 6|nr:methanogenesis marker 6 protein [Candidatus Methanoculleus thermohydrogenotrophicum]NLM82510.1 methanogenesis marker 6 protein [Candidatus Methanoculleus thermohydrogenotrophicum]HOB18745.1 methanogenesis marker 6 protein [Candidatus Methanoculleus thermohydrogenotrophicum]HPZ38539.1 methanogenesis marker 6 protein [Candidatus Methanoculleus thermohydrogenotrophicum]HQC91695.1 methanogenesis marker 6 protein [Candidatus Methanoculleus thermohydrogenotrophicum]
MTVEYIPDYVGTVTKYVFVESPSMTPGELALRAYEASEGVLIKETCFGLQVTGEPEAVDRLVAEIRTFDPNHIFVKDRGFPPGDPRRCRANLGGARPGYLGHEREFRILRYITRGLEALERGEEVPEAVPAYGKKPVLDIKRLQELIDEES